jgi:hypothetical protein
MLGAGELTFLAEVRGPEYPSDQLLLPKLVLRIVHTVLLLVCINAAYHRLNMEADLQSLFGLHVT